MYQVFGITPSRKQLLSTTIKVVFLCFQARKRAVTENAIQNKEKHMKKFRTTVSVIIMILAGIAGFFAGSAVTDGMGGAILFSMIAGIGCIVYTADNRS